MASWWNLFRGTQSAVENNKETQQDNLVQIEVKKITESLQHFTQTILGLKGDIDQSQNFLQEMRKEIKKLLDTQEELKDNYEIQQQKILELEETQNTLSTKIKQLESEKYVEKPFIPQILS